MTSNRTKRAPITTHHTTQYTKHSAKPFNTLDRTPYNTKHKDATQDPIQPNHNTNTTHYIGPNTQHNTQHRANAAQNTTLDKILPKKHNTSYSITRYSTKIKMCLWTSPGQNLNLTSHQALTWHQTQPNSSTGRSLRQRDIILHKHISSPPIP